MRNRSANRRSCAAAAPAESPPSLAAVPQIRRVQTALADRFGHRNVLINGHDGLLACITSGGLRGAPGELAHHLLNTLGTDTGWRIGIGRPHSGPDGVLQSYEEARNTLRPAERLGFRTTVLNAADLLVFPVLLRDRAAIRDERCSSTARSSAPPS